MIIQVNAFASLRKYFLEIPLGDTLPIEMQATATAGDLAVHLGIPKQDIQFVMLNHTHAALDTLLSDGDRVIFIPLIDGG